MSNPITYLNLVLVIYTFLLLGCGGIPAESKKAKLVVEAMGPMLEIDRSQVIISQTQFSNGGSTSARNNSKENLKWKEQGYYQRNRDLGQVFIAPEKFKVDEIILRTGPSDKAVLSNTPDAAVFIQFFEVLGEPTINDNQTGIEDSATHGFTSNHRADDFIEGVTYDPFFIASGGFFPQITPTESSNSSDDESGKLHYMRWIIKGDVPSFQANKRYAFLVGFSEPGEAYGFTLANHNGASSPGKPDLADEQDPYPPGWSIRREGNGQYPPLISGENTSPTQKHLDDALFPSGKKRFSLTPTSDGYPDVDTYRDLEFYIIKR